MKGSSTSSSTRHNGGEHSTLAGVMRCCRSLLWQDFIHCATDAGSGNAA